MQKDSPLPIAQISYFDPASPIAELSGDLPHWRQDGTTYFVTFRLADSLPSEKLAHWRQEHNEWLRLNSEPHSPAVREEYFNKFPSRLQYWLDAGYGSRILQIPEVKLLVENALRFFHGKRYELDEFVVAANHVHVIVTPLLDFELSAIMHSWKSFTAHEILKIRGAADRLRIANAHGLRGEENLTSPTNGSPKSKVSVWQKESFDHIVRSPESLGKFRAYIRGHASGNNGASRA